jgi:hypothetical protein
MESWERVAGARQHSRGLSIRLVTMKRLRGSGQDLDDIRMLEGDSDVD